MNSTPDLFPSYHGNFGDSEWMIDGTACQYTSVPGITASSQLELDQNWVSQQLEGLMAVTAHIAAKLQELQDLYQKKQDILARLKAFNATTATLAWNIPPQLTPSTSSSTATYAQNPPPQYTTHTRAGMYDTPRNGEVAYHRETLARAKKSYICHCGKPYTRKDSLVRHLRHAAIHASEIPDL